MIQLPNSLERVRFIRFALVGLAGTLIDIASFNLLTQVFNVAAILASTFSFSLAVTSNFWWNRVWTFPDSRSKSFRKQITQFALVNTAGLAIRTPIFILFDQVLNRLPAFYLKIIKIPYSAEVVRHNLALGAAIALVLIWNFYANRYWTYNDINS